MYTFSLGRYFLPNVIVKIFEDDSTLQCIESDLETCVAEKFLELGRIRPVFRFQIFHYYLSVIQLEANLQFGLGSTFEVFFYLASKFFGLKCFWRNMD